ncbi:hypothetical protein D9619_011494 [Psilocybe cf. subviscida]|uniref:VOC domain-containing protein n=1 Tax=Psilocybe cf. subviscida TaxID=2480587 RepID=A0A8H5BTL9_9AGAR|nr:hypothetical protein D9619_011494 [Psilocybe cf. subviscida]
MGINHIGIIVSDIDKAKAFYTAALAPLGYKEKMSFQDGKVLGFGAGFAPDFWIAGLDAMSAHGSEARHTGEGQIAGVKATDANVEKRPTGPMHIAFNASNRQHVRDFHKAAIAAGGVCNGTPGTRPVYFSTYYGAFVMDPEGRNLEAVCMKPGFWAEPWGFLGWATFGLVLGGVGAYYVQYAGLL